VVAVAGAVAAGEDRNETERITTEIVPSMRGSMMRFEFPEGQEARILLDINPSVLGDVDAERALTPHDFLRYALCFSFEVRVSAFFRAFDLSCFNDFIHPSQLSEELHDGVNLFL